MIGRSIGRFRILAPLGIGGMASVWRARDELLGRELALKILAEALARSEDSRRRFRHEALIAAGLDHPGIAAVYDSGDTDGHTWIAMALIEGETLAERIARSLVPVRQVVSTSLAAADALGFAHERRVVHRDVTSRNVMLGRDGRVFVLDFGLALAHGTSRISSSGTTVGTAPYMAPELLLGATADARSDLYGLGVVMYEALTGTLPFAGDQPATAIFARLNQPVRPAKELRPEMSPALDAIVLRCLAREPADRFADAEELAAALRAVDLRGIPEAGPAVARSDADPMRAMSPAPPHSVTAERLADRTGITYLAIPPFEWIGEELEAATDSRPIARGLTAAARAGLSQLQRLHIVPSDSPPTGSSPEALRDYARALGANLLVLGTVRRSGTRLRVTCQVHDPEASLQLAGDALEGSVLDAFELEDRVIASLRRVLAHEGRGPGAASRTRPRDPASAEHFQQALLYLRRHDDEASLDAAIASLERLIESEGSTASYHASLARAFVLKYDRTRQRVWEARAATAAARAAELAPDAPETLLAMGELHRSVGRMAEAEREFGLALAQKSDLFEARLGRARALHSLGRLEEGERECQVAVAGRPDDWRGYSMLGFLRFMRGRSDLALEPWRRAAELSPNNPLAARNLGSALFRLDRFEESALEYQRSLDQQPNDVAYSNLGTALFFLGRYAEAVDAFDRGARLVPADPINWGNLGNALRFIPERAPEVPVVLERAIGLMKEQLQRSPGDAESWGRLAGWLANLGRQEEARIAVGEALARGPDDPHCLSHAGHVYCRLGEHDEAVRHLRRAVANGYGVQALARSPDLACLRGAADFEALLSSARGAGPAGANSPGSS